MQNKHYTFAEIMVLDKAIHQLAAYEVTGGLIVSPQNEEEYDALTNKINHTFNRFKRSIQAGEFSFEELRDHILYVYGPYHQKKLTVDQEATQILNAPPKTETAVTEENVVSPDFKCVTNQLSDINSGAVDFLMDSLLNMALKPRGNKDDKIDENGPICTDQLPKPAKPASYPIFTPPPEAVEPIIPKKEKPKSIKKIKKTPSKKTKGKKKNESDDTKSRTDN